MRSDLESNKNNEADVTESQKINNITGESARTEGLVSEVLSSADGVIENAPVGVANWINRDQQTAVAGKTNQPKAVVMGSLSNKQTDSLQEKFCNGCTDTGQA